MDSTVGDSKSKYDSAYKLFESEDYEAAAEILLTLLEDSFYGAYAYFVLGEISNITGDPLAAKDLYYKALEVKPDLYVNLLSPDHPNYDYVFTGMKYETPVEACPLCGKSGEPIWCYPTMRFKSLHLRNHNPVRVWMYCKDCHHIYAEEFPEQEVLESGTDLAYANMFKTNTSRFDHYSFVLSKLSGFTEGRELLEIGLGGCECVLVAVELGFDVFGVDIMDTGVALAKKYGIEAELQDFMSFETERKWDIIIFGDVIEHVSDPRKSIVKLYDLLKDDGVLWLSTPNFDSAFSVVNGHDDGMRLEVSHKNYFSRISLLDLLEQCGFVPVDYQLSPYFPGSMEVIAVKDVRGND